jgi:hypothetical protein
MNNIVTTTTNKTNNNNIITSMFYLVFYLLFSAFDDVFAVAFTYTPNNNAITLKTGVHSSWGT